MFTTFCRLLTQYINGPAFVAVGLISRPRLKRTLDEMEAAGRRSRRAGAGAAHVGGMGTEGRMSVQNAYRNFTAS